MPFVSYMLALSLFMGVAWSSPTTGRVVGGHDAASKQFPHQISLRFDNIHICGGSIISDRYVLTAAHCVVNDDSEAFPADRFTIRAGTINRIAGGVIVPVKRVLVHPSYVLYNDLALLELEEELIFTETIKAIELMEGEIPDKSDVIISGWGLTEHAVANLPIIMQWSTVTAINKTECRNKIGFFNDALLCLDHPSGAGSCSGDSGSPATYDGKVAGVSSFVYMKCATSNPDGYSKVAYNIEWIKENMI